MTREEAIAKLKELSRPEASDVEILHGDADQVLCDLLVTLGYQDVVDAWDAVPKWYA